MESIMHSVISFEFPKLFNSVNSWLLGFASTLYGENYLREHDSLDILRVISYDNAPAQKIELNGAAGDVEDLPAVVHKVVLP
jgi:hypothetical protein